jgi:hypothetical protein
MYFNLLSFWRGDRKTKILNKIIVRIP